jgi:hypothetical protein
MKLLSLNRMNIQAEKLDIIQWLAGVNDIKTIRQFKLLKESNESPPTVSLTQAERDAIDKGLVSVKEGRIKSHEEVEDETRKKYPQLFPKSDR